MIITLVTFLRTDGSAFEVPNQYRQSKRRHVMSLTATFIFQVVKKLSDNGWVNLFLFGFRNN